MFKKLKYFVIAVIALAVSLLFLPYVPNTTVEGEQRTAQLNQKQNEQDKNGKINTGQQTDQPANLVIGVSWPIAQLGPELVNGIELAIAKINAEQQLKYKIELIVRDDLGDSRQAQNIATEFAAHKNISAVIGYAHDHQVAATVGTLQRGKLLQIVAGATNIELARHKHPYLVQLTPNSSDIAKQLAESVINQTKTFALLTEKRGYQTTFAQDFAIRLKQQGAKHVYNQSYDHRVIADFSRYIQQIKSANPDVVLFSGSSAQAAQFIQLAEKIGLVKPILCNCNNSKIIRTVANKAPVIIPMLYTPELNHQANQTFVNDYQQQYGQKPNQWAAQGYDSMLILANAIAQTDALKSLDLAWSIHNMDPFNGVSGLYQFSTAGELINKPIYIQNFALQSP